MSFIAVIIMLNCFDTLISLSGLILVSSDIFLIENEDKITGVGVVASTVEKETI